jgi:predicted dehydrogenase
MSGLRIGVVGTGFGARVVAPVFAATDGCEVVDVVSARDAVAVGELCARRDVDLVAVHSPPFLHRTNVEQAVASGHAVLCDKPFGLDAAEAAVMRDRAGAAGVVGLVNLELRWEPARRRLRDLLVAGELGTVEHVTWTHLSSGSRVPLRPYGWLFDRARGGGWLRAWGSHAVDALRWWLGDLSVRSAELVTTVPERPDADGVPHAVDADDAFRATLRSASGARITVDAGFAATASLAPRVVVAGSSGVAEVVADRRIVVRRRDGSRDEWDAPVGRGGDDVHLAPMRRWAEVVRDCVRAGSSEAVPDAATFTEGVAMATVLDAIRRAGRAPTSG